MEEEVREIFDRDGLEVEKEDSSAGEREEGVDVEGGKDGTLGFPKRHRL